MNGGFSQNSLSSQVHRFGGLCKNPPNGYSDAFRHRAFPSPFGSVNRMDIDIRISFINLALTKQNVNLTTEEREKKLWKIFRYLEPRPPIEESWPWLSSAQLS
jgi:hypothetical protein